MSTRYRARACALVLGAAMLLPAAPALAQFDFSGEWVTPRAVIYGRTLSQQFEDGPDRADGPEMGDYTGLPLNEFGRRKADAWSASVLAQPERQGNPHPAQYSMRGGGGPNLRIMKVIDPVTSAWIGLRMDGFYNGGNRTIWLDGRPHPGQYAEHLWSGFSTGVWQGHMLKVTTTHMKLGFLRRNGVPSSSRTTMTEYFVRHGTYLTVITILEDPDYLEDYFVRDVTLRWAPELVVGPPSIVDPSDELGDKPLGWVPHNPPGTRHTEFAERFGLPFEATRGGAETVYPEYQKTLAELIARDKAARTRQAQEPAR
ncbi:MAG: hypothetical protein AB7G23_02050 [Vicinamibacterales bacterium]